MEPPAAGAAVLNNKLWWWFAHQCDDDDDSNRNTVRQLYLYVHKVFSENEYCVQTLESLDKCLLAIYFFIVNAIFCVILFL